MDAKRGRELYEHTYEGDTHFSFGQNWQEYLARFDEGRVKQAEEALVDLCGPVTGKTFVDIGSGSGLFSLAAYRLGAKHVLSVDADRHSIACAEQLRTKFGDRKRWEIRHGSALDSAFMIRLGTFDIVYSWGVLHHTGDMHAAFDNVDLLVRPEGTLAIAIYNRNERHRLEGTSRFWSGAKRRYNSAGKTGKRMMEKVYTGYLLAGITATGHNPVKYVRNYRTLRGMDFWTDIKDWLGGFPYEYASAAEVIGYFRPKGYALRGQKLVRSLGCNEFTFTKLKATNTHGTLPKKH